MDEVRMFMAGRLAPFRLQSLRAIFVTPEGDLDEEDKVCSGAVFMLIVVHAKNHTVTFELEYGPRHFA